MQTMELPEWRTTVAAESLGHKTEDIKAPSKKVPRGTVLVVCQRTKTNN